MQGVVFIEDGNWLQKRMLLPSKLSPPTRHGLTLTLWVARMDLACRAGWAVPWRGLPEMPRLSS